MTTQPDKLKSPAGQGKVLSQRLAKVESGKGEFLTLAQLKKRLAKRTAREWCSFSLKPPRTLNKPGIFMTLKRPASGVGDYCADSLLTDLESLTLYHGIHPRHFGLHRMLAHRFAFGIYYHETETATQVLAVLDLRRDPNWIRSELAWRR